MPESESLKICLLGASFETGNLGFSALTESAIKCILKRWPNASIALLGTDRLPGQCTLEIDGRVLTIEKIPIRFSKKFWLSYHFLTYLHLGVLWKIFPCKKIRDLCKRKNPYFQRMMESDFMADLTGGDSFSDIYGIFRMILGFLCKWLVLFYGKPLYLFPQTYGPYRRSFSKWMARYVMKRAKMILVRDRVGVDFLYGFIRDSQTQAKIRFVPDVAFVLDPRSPKKIKNLPEGKGSTLIGMNVSGLLYHGGYSRDNMFQLSLDYPSMVEALIRKLLAEDGNAVLLIPHVFPPPDFKVESDPVACQQIFNAMKADFPHSLFLAEGSYDHNEIKYIIGQCQVMIGSRMHSCIAALSQQIPTLGLAYSKKFYGVFESAGMQDWVVDLREITKDGLFLAVDRFLAHREFIQQKLEVKMPEIREQVLRFCFEMPCEINK